MKAEYNDSQILFNIHCSTEYTTEKIFIVQIN